MSISYHEPLRTRNTFYFEFFLMDMWKVVLLERSYNLLICLEADADVLCIDLGLMLADAEWRNDDLLSVLNGT